MSLSSPPTLLQRKACSSFGQNARISDRIQRDGLGQQSPSKGRSLHSLAIGAFFLLTTSFSYADYQGIEIPSRIDEKVWNQLEQSVRIPPKVEVSVKRGYGNLNNKQRHALWKDLANTALVWKVKGGKELKQKLRRNIMAICTYESWFDPTNEFGDLEAAKVALQIAFAMPWMNSALAPVELDRVHRRLGSQLKKYLAIARGETSSTWWGVSNHPNQLPHLAAIQGMAQIVRSSNRLLAGEAKAEADRQLKRYHSLMDADDGSALSLAPDRDFEQQFYLLLIDLLDDDRISPKWNKRLQHLQFLVLPGQDKLVDWTGKMEMRSVHMIPFLRTLGQRLPSPEANHLAERLFSSQRSFVSPWSFLGAAHALPHAPKGINHNFVKTSFPKSGLYVGRESRRAGAAQLYFRAGAPSGQQAYASYLEGRPDLDFEHLLPDQGSFLWHHKGRLVLGHQVMGERPMTSEFNTLTLGHHGQILEGYPRYSPRHWPKKAGGRVFLDKVHGHSWLLGAQLKGGYPSEVGLESWVRLLLWVGPGILIQIDEIALKRPLDLTVHYHSPQLPLSLKDDGFYQRISGMRMISKSFPQGKWAITDRGAVGQNTSFVATESLNTQNWSRVNLMGPESIVSDAWVEQLTAGTGLDFQRKNIRFAYQLDDSGLKVSLKVREKMFFDEKLSFKEL